MDRGATADAGDPDTYRVYAMNHEVGHALGRGSRTLPADRALAPIIMQQSWGVANNDLNPAEPGPHPCRRAGLPDQPLPLPGSLGARRMTRAGRGNPPGWELLTASAWFPGSHHHDCLSSAQALPGSVPTSARRGCFSPVEGKAGAMPVADGDRHRTGPDIDRGLTGRLGVHPGVGCIPCFLCSPRSVRCS